MVVLEELIPPSSTSFSDPPPYRHDFVGLVRLRMFARLTLSPSNFAPLCGRVPRLSWLRFRSCSRSILFCFSLAIAQFRAPASLSADCFRGLPGLLGCVVLSSLNFLGGLPLPRFFPATASSASLGASTCMLASLRGLPRGLGMIACSCSVSSLRGRPLRFFVVSSS